MKPLQILRQMEHILSHDSEKGICETIFTMLMEVGRCTTPATTTTYEWMALVMIMAHRSERATLYYSNSINVWIQITPGMNGGFSCNIRQCSLPTIRTNSVSLFLHSASAPKLQKSTTSDPRSFTLRVPFTRTSTTDSSFLRRGLLRRTRFPSQSMPH